MVATRTLAPPANVVMTAVVKLREVETVEDLRVFGGHAIVRSGRSIPPNGTTSMGNPVPDVRSR